MIEKLKKILKQEDTVLFIGSGISIWSGLPSWKELINELIKFLKENGLDPSLTELELKEGDLLQAASYGFDRLTKPQFAEFIRNSCRLNIARPDKIHEKIVSLGPTCYITTNYDKLLELSFQKWVNEVYFRTIINKQLTETAEILSAKAKNFLFKFHGDVEDSDSIILTREQYRSLNSGGELYYALETVKTLMLSRPIVYMGFGLRDPDFLYIKDLIFNTYKGGTRDHYAIMADVNEQEKEYWRRNFGIHLISYKTNLNENGTKDHSPLLELLDKLRSFQIDKNTPVEMLNSDFILNLNRHAAKYSSFDISKMHLPLVVQPLRNNNNNNNVINELDFLRYYEMPVEKLLDNGPDKFILIGLPGAGKTYSLKRSVARLAKALNQECIEDSIRLNETIIPIFIDLKLYQGNIISLIEQHIPSGMNLESLSSNFLIKLYLDAFNEIPREFIESNQWNSDFSNLLQSFPLSVIISSRTTDGLDNLNFQIFNLDSISKSFIEKSLMQRSIEINDLFKNEVFTLLQKPFFYKLIFEDNYQITSNSTPQEIYSDLIKQLNNKFVERFHIELNLLNPLTKVAMYSIDHGEEAYKIDIIKRYLEDELKVAQITILSSSQIVNWLVSQNFVVPIINERICFFHQSITEYLAAIRLAEIFTADEKVLKEKLKFRRWDQVLFLTISLLGETEAKNFLETIIELDLVLSLSSIKYIEGDTKEIVNQLLIEIESMDFTKSNNFSEMHQIAYLIKSQLPKSEFNSEILKKIINKGDSLGGSAVCHLLDVHGSDFINEVFALLVEKYDDYNFCSEIRHSLKKYVTEDDLPRLLLLCKEVQNDIVSTRRKLVGFSSALGKIMKGFKPEQVYNTFFDPLIPLKGQKVQFEVLRDFLQECTNNDGLSICTKLLLLGIKEISVELYFILKFSKPEDNIDYSVFTITEAKLLIQIVKSKSENAKWALGCLEIICSSREDIAAYVLEQTTKCNGILKAAFYYSVSKTNKKELVFSALEELLTIDSDKLSHEPFALLSHMDELDWNGHESLFVKLLKLRNLSLAYNLCDRLTFDFVFKDDLAFDFGPIKWWLDWFNEFLTFRSKEWMFIDRVPSFISKYASKEKRKEFIEEFNNANSIYRNVLLRTILKYLDGLTLNEFTDESIAYLLNELKTIKMNFFNYSILVDIATEKFVIECMLPRLEKAQGKEHKNLEIIIKEIGKKHNRRYLIE